MGSQATKAATTESLPSIIDAASCLSVAIGLTCIISSILVDVLWLQKFSGGLGGLVLVMSFSRCTLLHRGCTYRPSKTAPSRILMRVVQILYYFCVGLLFDGIFSLGTSWFGIIGMAVLYMFRTIYLAWALSLFTGAEFDGSSFSPVAAHWRVWGFVHSYFKGSGTVLSIEWRNLTDEVVENWRSKQQYIFGMHPHGSFPFGGMVNGLTAVGDLTNVCADPSVQNGRAVCREKLAKSEAGQPRPSPEMHSFWFRKVRLRAGAASYCFWCPGQREIFLRLGIADVSETYVKGLLSKGMSCAIFPGGAKESGYATPGVYRVYLFGHVGFLRVALERGLDVVPVYTFGDEGIFRQMQNGPAWFDAMQKWMREVTGVLVPPGWLHLIPNRIPLTMVMGVPVDLSDLRNVDCATPVSPEALAEAVRRYAAALTKLFDDNKALVPGGHGNARLIIE